MDIFTILHFGDKLAFLLSSLVVPVTPGLLFKFLFRHKISLLSLSDRRYFYVHLSADQFIAPPGRPVHLHCVRRAQRLNELRIIHHNGQECAMIISGVASGNGTAAPPLLPRLYLEGLCKSCKFDEIFL